MGGDLSKKLSYTNEPQQVGEARTVSGAFPIRSALLDGEVRIGHHVVANPEVTLAEPMRGVNLGGRLLEAYAVTFDQANHRVRFSSPQNPNRDQRAHKTAVVRTITRAPLDMVMGRPVITRQNQRRGTVPVHPRYRCIDQPAQCRARRRIGTSNHG